MGGDADDFELSTDAIEKDEGVFVGGDELMLIDVVEGLRSWAGLELNGTALLELEIPLDLDDLVGRGQWCVQIGSCGGE